MLKKITTGLLSGIEPRWNSPQEATSTSRPTQRGLAYQYHYTTIILPLFIQSTTTTTIKPSLYQFLLLPPQLSITQDRKPFLLPPPSLYCILTTTTIKYTKHQNMTSDIITSTFMPSAIINDSTQPIMTLQKCE